MKNNQIPVILVTVTGILINFTLGLAFPAVIWPVSICTVLIILMLMLP